MIDSDERIKNALAAITEMSGFDGAHHKQYCIDQVVRAICGGAMINDYEYEKTDEYEQFVAYYRTGEDGPDVYDWDEGISP